MDNQMVQIAYNITQNPTFANLLPLIFAPKSIETFFTEFKNYKKEISEETLNKLIESEKFQEYLQLTIKNILFNSMQKEGIIRHAKLLKISYGQGIKIDRFEYSLALLKELTEIDYFILKALYDFQKNNNIESANYDIHYICNIWNKSNHISELENSLTISKNDIQGILNRLKGIGLIRDFTMWSGGTSGTVDPCALTPTAETLIYLIEEGEINAEE